MNDYALARVLHLLGVVIWIGGVAMVTTVLLPAVKKFKSKEERVKFFGLVESKFAWQARFTTLLTGLSGFYMLYRTGTWSRYLDISYWWIHAMTLVWLLFTLMLFLLEPLFLHRWFLKNAESEPVKTFKIIQRLHWFLLFISLLTIAGAVAGSHGWYWL